MDDTVDSSEPRPVPSAPPSGRIGKYELLHALGAGGMGIVWAARDPDLDREVAIKVLRAASASHEQRTRLLREARAMARLKHPNVLTVYEVDSDGDRDFIAMELVDGSSLDVWLREKPPARDVWDALLAAGRGLAAAHEAGLVHRDFKPHNVLRSRDGRVLVTDFGLARGRDDTDPLAATIDPGAGDSVLDMKLTSTGQLLGTPAYMAPEQFAGAAPDPRTDQFAFCVTAWEALSGERPFRGASIDALRTETARGMKEPAKVPGAAKLPGAVRAVLVRGLAPNRDERWPDVPALLRALSHARRAPMRRLLIAAPLVVLAVAGGAVFAHHGRTVEPGACAPGDQLLADTWSPAIRTDLLAKHPAATAAAQAFDDHAKRWLTGYQHACTRSPTERKKAVDCYLGARDELAVQVEIVVRSDAGALANLEPWGVLAGRDTCAGDAPIASLRLPDDTRRARAIGLLARAYGSVSSAPENVTGEQASLRDEVKQLDWPPLAARIDEAIAIASSEDRDERAAHRNYRSAAELARAAGDLPEEARARLGVVRTGRDDIGDEMPANAYADEARDAEVAIKAAGDDPQLRAALEGERAAHAAYGEYDLSRAIELGQHAYTQLHDLHDVRGSLRVADDLTRFLVLRGARGDLERADAIATEVGAAVEHTPFRNETTDAALQGVRAWAAWFKGDLMATHAALDHHGGLPIVIRGPRRTGHVVDEAGRPVAGARVVAWSGDMFGDATRVYSERAIALQSATTDEHGAFTIEAADNTAIIAEHDSLRSIPVGIASGAQLVLHPTHSISGMVDLGGNIATGVEPYVRIDVTPQTAWFDTTAPAPDGHFTIVGVPAAPGVRLGVEGTSWPRQTLRFVDAGLARDGAVIHWPVGPSIDYIVKLTSGKAWVLRGKVAPKTRADVERLVRASPDAATTNILPVGWANATFTGIRVYGVSEHHFAFADNAPGPITVCVGEWSETSVRCHSETIDAGMQTIDRDSRHWFGGEAADFDAVLKP